MATSTLLKTLRPYQVEYLRDDSRRKAWAAARRVGKTYTISLEKFLEALPGDVPDNLIVSQDQESSNDVLRYVRGWSRYFVKMGVPEARIVRDRATEVVLGSGARVVAIPGGRPAAIRHYGGNVTFDEAEHHRDLKANMGAAGPAISEAGGKLRMVSTVLSDIGEFYAILDGKRPGWSVHRTTIHDAIRAGHCKRDGSPIDIEELRLDVPDPSIFACEFELVPLSESDAYIGKDILDACAARWDKDFKGGAVYGGFDIARSERGHKSAIVEIRRDGDRYQAQVVTAERGLEFDVQEQLAVRTFRSRGWVRMAIDAQGIGAGPAERIRKTLGSARVEEVHSSPQTQVDMMTDLKAAMQGGRFAIDPADRDLWLDVYSIRRKIGASGRISFEADVTNRGHADRAWALALAVRAAGRSSPATSGGITSGDRRDWGSSLGNRQDW